MKKRKKIKKTSKWLNIGESGTSTIFVWLMFLVFSFAVLFVGGLGKIPISTSNYNTQPIAQQQPIGSNNCCDTGNDMNCGLVPGRTISFNEEPYGLLRSYIISGERGVHIYPLNPPQFTLDGEEIFVNNREGFGGGKGKVGTTCTPDNDWYFREKADGSDVCFGLPDDSLILVCNKINPPATCTNNPGKAVWDAYLRVRDVEASGIPDFIKRCNVPIAANGAVVAGVTAAPKKNNLQLETFSVTAAPSISKNPVVASYLTPYCKPAIYLYPQTTMPVNVQVFPVGPMTVTIPKYPKAGWNVIADIAGNIQFANKSYDYLYWEAQIPDEKITVPPEGYVVAYNNLEGFLPGLLSQLGLNNKERTQFTDYWTTVLPESPYYKIAVIPQTELDMIAPLSIFPSPQTTIRVTLHFTPIEQFETIPPPVITAIQRNGFTVVEWGGLFKRDKIHPFSCFM